MSDNVTTNNPVQQEGLPPSPVSDAGTPPVDTGAEWEQRYKGLQRAYDKLVKENTSLKEKLVELQARIEELESERSRIIKEAEQHKTRAQELESEAKKLMTERTRMRLILANFPELAPFEAKGVLPTAETEEELMERLREFKETIETVVGQSVKAKLSGSSLPTGKSSQKQMSREEIIERMMEIAGVPSKRDEYETLQRMLDEID